MTGRSRQSNRQVRIQFEISGIVQGVGFRPFIYSLASRLNLGGWVYNHSRGVTLEVEGAADRVAQFESSLIPQAPPLAIIEQITSRELPPTGETVFEIRESAETGEKFTLISPDIATCADCLAEMKNPDDRRHDYPFLNCTNCGPRFTIIRDVPYDRDKTTMAPFPMCPECLQEYHDPENRRFHAQPTACPACGPELVLYNSGDNRRPDFSAQASKRADSPISTAIAMIRDGRIIAVKGIGGYHLACDAMNETAVSTLRARKFREDKPFALMAASVNRIRDFCQVSEAEERLLVSVRRPIVLLQRLPQTTEPLAESVAPGNRSLGFMLPYSPLHYLLFREDPDMVLVLTSGNISDEPIACKDEDAFERLRGIADAFLIHNREIHVRCDDSVTRIYRGQDYPLRRSRGYVPGPVKLAKPFPEDILACGAEQKNTFCFGHGEFAFMGHHIGDLENAETLKSFEEGIEHFKRLFNLNPEIAACDLHPEYLSTRYALELPGEWTRIGVQHHHAHIASCLADNNVEGPVIGLSMDGTGYGEDGNIWGGEILIADTCNYRRASHLKYLPLPGGSKAIREPWRMAAVYLQDVFGPQFIEELEIASVRKIDRKAWTVLSQAVSAGINSPLTSSMGRLFDAVSAIINIRDKVNYEGQAAVEMEQAADPSAEGRYRFEITAEGIIDTTLMIRGIVDDLLAGETVSQIAGRFHNTVAGIFHEACRKMRQETGLAGVALSGGVFQNMLLLEKTVSLLEQDGFAIYTHHRVPANDGGISLGQAVIASRRIHGKH